MLFTAKPDTIYSVFLEPEIRAATPVKGKAVPIGQKEHRGGTGIFHQPRCRKTGCKRRACAPDPGGGPPAPAAPASNCCHTVCRSGPRSSPPVCGIRYPGGAVCLRWRWYAERAGSGRGRQRECSGRLCALRQRERLCAQLRRGGPSAFFRFCRPAAGTALPGWTCCKHPLVSESISAPPGWTLRWHMASQNSGGCRDAGEQQPIRSRFYRLCSAASATSCALRSTAKSILVLI